MRRLAMLGTGAEDVMQEERRTDDGLRLAK